MLIDMTSEISELVPGMSRVRARTLINRAFRVAQDSMLWSFQLGIGGFSTPDVTTAGSISIPFLGSNQIIGDATATAAWQSLGFYWAPTLQQIRANGYSIYSIIAFDTTTNAPFGTLTLDRPFIDPLPFLSGVGYEMFQAYIAAPVGFKRWLTIADMFNCWALDIWTLRRTVDLDDPARLYTSNPSLAAPLGQDKRGAGTPTPSATLGQQLYELYPEPQSEISYQTYYVAYAPPLVNNTDTLPAPLTDEVIVEKALTWAYRDAEGRRDTMAAKGSTGNYLGLKKLSEETFKERLKTLRIIDRDAVDSYMIDMRTALSGFRGGPYFNSITGRANMGRF